MNWCVSELRQGLAASCLAAAALLACASCGGDGSETGAAASNLAERPPAKAQLIKRADAICRGTDAAQKAALTSYFARHEVEMTNGPQMENAISRAEIPPLRAEIAQVGALAVPAGDKASVDAILAAWGRALSTAQRQPSSVFGLGEGPFEKPNQLAKRYGFKDCAEAL